MKTPLSWLAERVRLGPTNLTIAAGTALVASVMIVVTGSIVRVTGSGLGCDTWPNCTAETLAPTAEMGVHGLIEFGNRLLAIVLCVIVGWLIVVARLQRDADPDITRWAWAQFWVIVLNAVVGGITVWTRLSPYVVAGHFLAAMLLVTAATVTWHKVQAREDARPPEASRPRVRRLAGVLLIATAALLFLGASVTGTGPHAGDSANVPRMPFNWTVVTVLHGAAATLAGIVALALWLASRHTLSARVHRRTTVLLVLVAAQAAVGAFQVASGLPELAVVLHLLGSALVWIGAVRVLLDARDDVEQRSATNPHRFDAPRHPPVRMTA
ncbi:COX15/CtaA family protein [Cellulosimicrobium sp. PMB13]|uniref:COX15/CtaA family protein n=1 Tax=Cellulosimicrobium sp. PMB13 TaxID=3120158 RepID=UPI003F4B3A1A